MFDAAEDVCPKCGHVWLSVTYCAGKDETKKPGCSLYYYPDDGEHLHLQCERCRHVYARRTQEE